MALATFEVPTTAVYTDSVTGSRNKFYAGHLVALETAVRYGMTGAEAPAEPDPFTDAERAYVAAQLVGESTVALGDLSDVTITNPQEGDVLTYVADWENG